MITQPIGDAPDKTQDVLLLYLKRQGELTVSDLCTMLGITSMAVRRHLAHLQKEGLVESRMIRQVRGRPTYHYKLAAKAEALFPSGGSTLAVDLLEAVFEQSGHKGVMELLTIRNEKRIARFKERFNDKPIEERVREISRIFSEDGYMTEWEAIEGGNFIIYQRHCAVHDMANQFRQLCSMEPQMMEALLGVKVTREKYILRDDPLCAYIVHANESKNDSDNNSATTAGIG
ncbi:MAG: ArsR family transcriptional regulator [Cyanobacteria bacterium REEB67]|nr:ArsR family transcriptional regulator [Cyanobacteria bacterium REEB67]